VHDKFKGFLTSHPLQFGYKKSTGCQDAVFAVQQTVNYFVCRGSTAFLSALGASKVFDKLSQAKLFNKLVARNAPSCLIDILIDWYSKLYLCVRWNSTLSEYFVVKLGVRQGGILSPFLFNVYVDDLLDNLESSGTGCYVNGHYLGCVMYTDDLLLLSASVAGLQHMLNICHTFGLNNSISFNHSKTICIKVGPRWQRQINRLCLGTEKLRWVTDFKYLGIVFKSGKTLKVDTGYIKRKFYTSCNCILAHCKSVDEFVKLNLVISYCLPLLSAVDVTGQQLQELAMCWNDCFLRIFGFKRHESVKLLQFYCNELPVEFMHDLLKWKFIGRHSSE